MATLQLLEDVVSAIVRANGNRPAIATLVYQTVYDRVGVMHERAQAAEGRAMVAEKRLRRLSIRVGLADNLTTCPTCRKASVR